MTNPIPPFTLRDEMALRFAVAMMSALMARTPEDEKNADELAALTEEIPQGAYEMADLMLKAREQ